MQVNLLQPQSVYLQHRTGKQRKVLPVTVGLIIVIFLLITVVVYFLEYRVEQELAVLRSQVVKFQQVEQVQREQQAYQQILRNLQQAQAKITAISPEHTQYLDALTKVLPSSVKLTRVAVEGSPWELKLAGLASNYEEVAQIGLQLHRNPLFQGSMVTSTGQKELGIEFQIIVPGGASK